MALTCTDIPKCCCSFIIPGFALKRTSQLEFGWKRDVGLISLSISSSLYSDTSLVSLIHACFIIAWY
uniref:Uncharacterized protein n=1 Tax=Pristionchus pacificus TaxID=54126 RepID=A0A2A6CZZ6_PRIPA|eukprot:PDM83690.1 hypothetical protein PRIPAC_30177 [Pristionchus pacificus]